MAAQALGPGTTTVRRRAFFGLLDAGGWAWATLKAGFWFVAIIMMMAYMPGPGPVRHRAADDRARRPPPDLQQEPRRHADQPLPARRRDPALPGPGRRGPAVAAEPAGARPPGGAHGRRDRGGRPRDAPRRRLGREGRPGQRLRDGHPAGRQHRRLDRGRRRCPRRGPGAAAVFFAGSAYRHRRRSTRPAARPTRSSWARRTRHGEDHVLDGVRRPEAARAARRRHGRHHGRRDLPRRRARRRPARSPSSGRRPSKPRPASSSLGASCRRCRTRGPGRRPSSRDAPVRLRRRGCRRTRRPRSCAARSASSRETPSRPLTGWSTPTEASAGEINLPVARTGAMGFVSNGILYYVGGEGGAGDALLDHPRCRGQPDRLEDARPERPAAGPPAARTPPPSSTARTRSSSAGRPPACRPRGSPGPTSRRRSRSSGSASSTSSSRRSASAARSASSSRTWWPPAWRPPTS